MNTYPTLPPTTEANVSNERRVGRFLRRDEVERETGLSRPTIYRAMKRGTFPKQVRIGLQAVGWWASEIEEWKRQRPFANQQNQ